MEVGAIRYTQDIVGSCFRDGSPLRALIEDLNAGKIDPLSAPSLRLHVVSWPRKGTFCVNNRRLYCLKQHRVFLRRFYPDIRFLSAEIACQVALIALFCACGEH